MHFRIITIQIELICCMFGLPKQAMLERMKCLGDSNYPTSKDERSFFRRVKHKAQSQ